MICKACGAETDEPPKRSSAANRYYWAVLLRTLGNELGYTASEMHEALKVKFHSHFDPSTGLLIVKSTAQDNTEEFWRYIDAVRVWSHCEMGIYLPEPNERAA